MKVVHERRQRSARSLVSHPRLVLALWLLVAYLVLLYAAFRWGHPSPDRYPGSA